MTTFLTSDTHFGHKNIIQHCRRPFADIEAMNQVLTDNWNARVGEGNTVWFLGDFAFYNPNKALAILEQLNGEKHLIIGNHDHRKLAESSLWKSASRFEEVDMMIAGEKRLVTLCHYPLVTWNQVHRGALHFHGHSHGNYPGSRQHLDVGVDCNGYMPMALIGFQGRRFIEIIRPDFFHPFLL